MDAGALGDVEEETLEIAALVDKSPATVSQHLGKLRLAGIVQSRRDGTFIHYTLADNHVGEVVEDALFHAEHLDDGSHRG